MLLFWTSSFSRVSTRCGSWLAQQPPASWLSDLLLAFSIFLFFSLALVKRYRAKLVIMRQVDGSEAKARGYELSDGELLSTMGTASGYLAVLVLALYIATDKARGVVFQPRTVVVPLSAAAEQYATEPVNQTGPLRIALATCSFVMRPPISRPAVTNGSSPQLRTAISPTPRSMGSPISASRPLQAIRSLPILRPDPANASTFAMSIRCHSTYN